MLDEIFREVARKYRLPVEQIELMYKSTIKGIRWYISNPLYSKTVIRLPGLGSWRMTDRSVRNYHRTDEVEDLQEYKEQFKRIKNVSKKRQD